MKPGFALTLRSSAADLAVSMLVVVFWGAGATGAVVPTSGFVDAIGAGVYASGAGVGVVSAAVSVPSAAVAVAMTVNPRCW